MVSDSDGMNFPWYGGKTETALIKGPTEGTTLHSVSMNDNFFPHVTWDIPTSTDRIVRLTNVKRDQSFLTWLVAMDVINCHFMVLKTFKWNMKLEISVNPRKALGSRAKLVSNQKLKQPEQVEKNIEIPNCALYPSNANSSQVLVWRTHYGDPITVVSPKSSHPYPKSSNKKRSKNKIQ